MSQPTVTPRSRILGTGRSVPARVVSNAELAGSVATTDAWIREHTGIERRHVAAEGETTSDLAAAAGRAALEASGLTVADLDMIVLATVTGDSPMPATAATVQQKLGADAIPSFDIAASGAGFLYALTVADQFIAGGAFRTVLVIGADVLSRLVDPKDRTAAPLHGDGAGALVLGPATGDGRGVLATRIHADGTQASMLEVQGGGSAAPMTPERLAEGMHLMKMDGRALFDAAVKHITVNATDALKAAGLTSRELDWVVPLQANQRITDSISKRLGFPKTKFIENVAEYGNTGAASVPIALDEAIRDGRVKPGQTVLLCALGAGLTWGSAIVRV